MGVILSHSLLCYLEQGLFLKLELMDFGRLAVQQAQGSSCLSFPSSSAQVQTHVMGTGDPHSGPQACMKAHHRLSHLSSINTIALKGISVVLW